MKELTIEQKAKAYIEQKAKAYDEALERTKKLLKNMEKDEYFASMGDIKLIFPELGESEDERIKKDVIALLRFGLIDGSSVAPGRRTTKEQAITWLEKQGEHLENQAHNNKEDEVNKNNALYIFNQLKDRLCSNSEYDKDILGAIEYCIKNNRPLEKEHIAWLEKQSNKETTQDKENKDERIRKAIICGMKTLKAKEKETFAAIPIDDCIVWLEKQGSPVLPDSSNNEPWTYEPKFKVKYAGSEYNVFETKDIAGVTFYGIEDEPNHIDYVKAENCDIISGYAIKENGSPYPTKPAVFLEQKPDEPKFKVKDIITNKYCRWDGSYRIKEIKDGKYIFDDGSYITTKEQDDWELVKQKPTWSEEDEKNLQNAIWYVENPAPNVIKSIMLSEWLKSLRQRIGGEK